MRVGYVYAIRRIITGLILYVGSCIDCAHRMQSHQGGHSRGHKIALQRYVDRL